VNEQPSKRLKYPHEVRHFGENVRREREARKMTQENLADESGLDIRTIQRIERFEINPSLDVVIGILKGLKIEPGLLIKSA
jgi:transcriptional regulator with XRE-family HTH domain